MRIKQRGSNQTEVQFSNGTLVFFSYETPVCAFRPHHGFVRIEDSPSRTTSKHIRDWLEFNGTTIDATPTVSGKAIESFIGAV